MSIKDIFFDTANGYSAGTSEEYLGNAIKKNVARDKVVIASKVYFNESRLSKKATVWIARIIATAIAIYGAYLFGSSRIYTYMFMQTHFAMFDYSKTAIQVIADNLIMMAAFVYIGYYLNKALLKKSDIPYVTLAVIVIVVSIISSVISGKTSQNGGWGSATANNSESLWTTNSSDTTGGLDTMQQIQKIGVVRTKHNIRSMVMR